MIIKNKKSGALSTVSPEQWQSFKEKKVESMANGLTFDKLFTVVDADANSLPAVSGNIPTEMKVFKPSEKNNQKNSDKSNQE